MSVFNAYIALSGAIDGEVRRDVPLARHTTYRIGGPAALMVTANTYHALVRTLEVLAQERVDWVVLGRGSNVLAADEGYRGCVVRLGREFSRMAFDGACVTAGAAVPMASLVRETLSRSLTGLEFCVGIPGTVGGAVAMDAGTRHEWVGSVVRDVVTLRPGQGMRRYQAPEVEWGYRWTSLPADEIILEATLSLAEGDKEAMARDMDARLARRSRTQPLGRPSCGSVFRNPGDQSVAQLIDQAGLKGYRVGGAAVSDQHANFIVNEGGATARDVMAVMTHVHDTVEREYGIDLTTEVKCLGFGK